MVNVIALLSIVLCWLSLTEAQNAAKAAEDAKAEQPERPIRAILHIGPHKTGTTSVQAMLESAGNHLSMKGENTYWPKHGHVVAFSRELGSHDEGESDMVAEMGHFLKKSRRRGRNVVLSTENFVWMLPQNILILKDMLQGFEVTIVAVYREYISLMVSRHYQTNRNLNGNHTPLSTYLMGLDVISLSGDLMTLLGQWEQVFGKDALKIVDYYGAIAAGKSVPRVVLCEAADVLCDAEEGEANISAGLELAEVYTDFCKFFASQPGRWEPCAPKKIRHGVSEKLDKFFTLAFEMRPRKLRNLPTVQSKLTTLVEHSVAWDTTVRGSYGDRMLYGNATANLQHAQNIQVSQVDFEALRKKSKWNEWMRSVYEDAVHQKLLCNGDIHMWEKNETTGGTGFYLLVLYNTNK